MLIIMILLLYIIKKILFSGLFLRKLKFWALCEIGFIYRWYELKLNLLDILPFMHSFYELYVKNANCTGAFLSGSLPCHKAFMLLVNVLCKQTHFLLLLWSCVSTWCTVQSSLAELLKITCEMMFPRSKRSLVFWCLLWKSKPVHTSPRCPLDKLHENRQFLPSCALG
jgi:hypothetical protein